MSNLFGYGLLEPSGEPYFDVEECVWGPDDHGKMAAESARNNLDEELPVGVVGYTVVKLFWQVVDTSVASSEPDEDCDLEGDERMWGYDGDALR